MNEVQSVCPSVGPSILHNKRYVQCYHDDSSTDLGVSLLIKINFKIIYVLVVGLIGHVVELWSFVKLDS